MKRSMLDAWMDLAGDTLMDFGGQVDWKGVGLLLADTLHSPVAGHLIWAPKSHATVSAYERTADVDLPTIAAQAASLHPLAMHYTRTKSVKVFAIQDVPSLRSENARLYMEHLRDHEIEQHLWIPVGSENGLLQACGACRSSDSFTKGERADAASIQHLLAGLVAHASASRSWAARLGDLAAQHTHSSNIRGRLSAREVLTLDLCALGKTSTQIGRILSISPRTVEKHLENAYRRLGVYDRVSAVQRARDEGLISTDNLG